jgi:hypothetical protein
MKGTVETLTRIPIEGDNEHAFDVTIKLIEHDDVVEFRSITYEERYSTFFAKPGSKIEIDVASHGRLRYMKTQHFTYTNK